MKLLKIILLYLIIIPFTNVKAKKKENIFHSVDFWKSKPNIKEIIKQINNNNDPKEYNYKQHDAVTLAIYHGAPLESILYLLSFNDINKITHDNRLYLHWATCKGSSKLVKYLLDKGSNINHKGSKGNTPLTFAAGCGRNDIDIYNMLFKKGINPLNKYKDGANILLLAIPNDNADLTLSNFFIKHGLSLNSTDDLGANAADYAAKRGNIKVIKALMNKNINPTNNSILKASEGYRLYSNNINIFKFLIDEMKLNPLIKDKNGKNAVHYLVKNYRDKSDIIDYLVNKGINLEDKDEEGNTPLILCAGTKNINILSYIIKKSVNINEVNNKKENALISAIKSGSYENVEILINNKINKYIKTNEGNLFNYLFKYHRTRNNLELKIFDKKFEILKQNNISLNEVDTNGNNIIHIICKKNNPLLYKFINKIEVNINNKNKDGMTPLHLACLNAKNLELIKILIKKGANKKIKDNNGDTPYDIIKNNDSVKNDINILKL